MHIELDIFSGRPNPTWELGSAVARRLEELHRRLQAATTGAPEPPGLGYRGFRYSLDGETWRAFRGVVAGPRLVMADHARSIERLLAEQLPADFRDLRPILETELEPDT